MTYYQNLTFEKIEVIVHYKDLEVNIIKFKWNNTVYKVDKVASKWKIPKGEKLETHFTVICE